MRISDWSSDVCSSDLLADARQQPLVAGFGRHVRNDAVVERGRIQGMEDRCRRGAGIAVEHHRSARHARREDGARNGSQLAAAEPRSEEHTSELQSLMRTSYAVFCLKKQKRHTNCTTTHC